MVFDSLARTEHVNGARNLDDFVCCEQCEYESNHTQWIGARFKATADEGWRPNQTNTVNWACLVKGTENSHLFAFDQCKADPWNCRALVSDRTNLFCGFCIGNTDCEHDLNNASDGRRRSFDDLLYHEASPMIFAGVSIMFLLTLCDAFRRTCLIARVYLFACPLRGSNRRGKFTYWTTLSFVLFVAIQLVASQILVIGGVHIRPDYLSIAFQFQAAVLSLALFNRFGGTWRDDAIGPRRRLSHSRKPAIRPRKTSIRLTALILCLNIATSHATHVFQSCEQGVISKQSLDADNARGVIGENDASDSSSPDLTKEDPTGPSGNGAHEPDTTKDWIHTEAQRELPRHDSGMKGLAQPEAILQPRDSHPFSRPCEGGCRSLSHTGDLEGQDQSSLSCNASTSHIGGVCQEMHVDDRPTILGDFDFDPRTQDQLGIGSSRDSLASRSQAGNIVFQEYPILAKVWFAPSKRCNGKARDVVIPKEELGNIGEVVCHAWEDLLPAAFCSFRIVWPQPEEHTYQELWHFVVYGGHGPTAVLLQNTFGVADEARHTEFCACALERRQALRSRREKYLNRLWKNGDLIQIVASEDKSSCDGHFGQNSGRPCGDNTATPIWPDQDADNDLGSLMQLEDLQELQVSTIRAMRFAHAVHHRTSIYETANFATQNFVKKDWLRAWVKRELAQEGDTVTLAVWRISPSSLVAHECRRVVLDGTNWARTFRQFWRIDEDSKTPVLAAVEPQPPVISGNGFVQLHIIATVIEIAEILGFTSSRIDTQPYAAYSQRDGQQRITFRKHQRIEVPDFSYVDIVFIESRECQDLIQQGKTGATSTSQDARDAGHPAEQKGDNTATPIEQDPDVQSLMQQQHGRQTSAQIEEERCFLPVLNSIRLYAGRESSWRLWNHFVRDRAWAHPRLDEMSAWILAEANFVQSIAITLFSSRQGSTSWNDPLALWNSLGGRQDPEVLMVFPRPTRRTLPEDHIIFIPADAHEREQRAFLVDVLDHKLPPPHIVERVAVRGNLLTPQGIANLLGYPCQGCMVLRGQCSTGSFLNLDITTETEVVRECISPGQSIKRHRISGQEKWVETKHDETTLFQFQPPPRQGAHTDGEAYFWVRKTIVYQAAIFSAALQAGMGHWPLLIVHFEEVPHQTRTFGFEQHQQVTTDQVRIRFRELYVDRFSTQASLCNLGRSHCAAVIEAGTILGERPTQIAGWQRIFVTITETPANDLQRSKDLANRESQAGGETDDHSFTQANLVRFGLYDPLTMYVFVWEDPFFGDIAEGQATVEAYCHLWHDREGPRRDHRPIIVRKSSPVATQIAQVWNPHIQVPSMRLVPVRPVPDFGLGAQPTVLVLDRESGQVVPVLFDYTSDDRVFTGTGLVDCTLGFPQVNAIFDLLVPDNDCRGDASCLVRANGRHYAPGQTVMLYEGIFIRLGEQDLQETTTEEVMSTDYDPAASAASTHGISSDASLRPEVPTSEPAYSESEVLPLTATTGPFFDLDSEGTLIVVDQDIDPIARHTSGSLLLLFKEPRSSNTIDCFRNSEERGV